MGEPLMRRKFNSDREAFWYGVRDGFLIVLASGMLGAGIVIAWEIFT